MEAHKPGFDCIDFAFYLLAVSPFMRQGPLQWRVCGEEGVDDRELVRMTVRMLRRKNKNEAQVEGMR